VKRVVGSRGEIMESIYLVTAGNLAEDSQSVTDALTQLLDAYELGGECRLRDEFDRIFARDSILT
jgi:hypothetical protein